MSVLEAWRIHELDGLPSDEEVATMNETDKDFFVRMKKHLSDPVVFRQATVALGREDRLYGSDHRGRLEGDAQEAYLEGYMANEEENVPA